MLRHFEVKGYSPGLILNWLFILSTQAHQLCALLLERKAPVGFAAEKPLFCCLCHLKLDSSLPSTNKSLLRLTNCPSHGQQREQTRQDENVKEKFFFHVDATIHQIKKAFFCQCCYRQATPVLM